MTPVKIQTGLHELKAALAKTQFHVKIALVAAFSLPLLLWLYISNLPLSTFHFAIKPLLLDLITPCILGSLAFSSIATLLRLTPQVQHMVQKIRSEERNLNEVVELLREIEPALAREEGFSVLERLQMRIRLSRFDIYTDRENDAPGASASRANGYPARKPHVDPKLTRPL